MDILTIEADRGERILASGIESSGADELREWFCYTKPLTEDMIVIARTNPHGDQIFSVHVAGNGSQTP